MDRRHIRKIDDNMARYREYQETANAIEGITPAYARQMRLDAMGALDEAYSECGYSPPIYDNMPW